MSRDDLRSLLVALAGWLMAVLFYRIFEERPSAQPMYGKRRYGYPTGNVELFIRHEQGGENLMAVLAQVQTQWKPGNEHLWDEYDPESLVDDEERLQYAVNQLLFSRVTLYRALRAAGRDVRGRDPFEFVHEVPKTLARLRERFPKTLGRG